MSIPNPPHTYKKARGHPVKWLSTDPSYTKLNTWLCAMLSGTYWYWLEIRGWWGLRIASPVLCGGRKSLYFFMHTTKRQSHSFELQIKVYYGIRHTVREFSSLESDDFKPSFVFIKALTKIGLLKLIYWFVLLLFYIGVLIRFSHTMQQVGFYHNTAFCFHGFHSAHNACKRMEKGGKKHDWWLLLEAHKHKQPALID